MPHRRPAKVISGNAHPGLAESLARELGWPVEPVEVAPFADGETRVHINAEVQYADVVIVQPTCPPVNDHLLVLALLIDAARAAGASRITALVPYFGYARQEQRSRCGDARSAQVVARLLGCAGLDHLVTLDLHAPAALLLCPRRTVHSPRLSARLDAGGPSSPSPQRQGHRHVRREAARPGS